MPKLWQKDYELNKQAEEFEVGADIYLDNRLASYDVYGSIAHAKMLNSIGILTDEDFKALQTGLLEILRLEAAGEFRLCPGDEDIHSKIENYLVAQVGVPGKKIHTGRSRNDQSLLDMRLFAKDYLLRVDDCLLDLAQELASFAQAHKDLPMPGYTHMQRAMISSAGLWASSFAESLLDDLQLLDAAYRLTDRCPLGSAASYGVSLPIDRRLVSDLLGFSKVQNNVLYCQNSRGKIEAAILQALVQVMLDLSRLAEDILLFSTKEFGFFSIADELLTGSSIMPQKKNVDVMELLRAKVRIMIGYQDQVAGICASLPSGYNRDMQETKGPFIAGLDLAISCLAISRLTVAKLKPNRERMIAACTPELFAAEKAYEMVRQGIPFRDAYHEVSKNIDTLQGEDPVAAIKAKTHIGGTGNLGLEGLQANLGAAREDVAKRREDFEAVIERLLALD
ncbi:MAG: argininosuccinate lyase [Candidatus Marsarchaeota archaeon]|nr:argininosuccinate lyase [Candidatus Marsarchaeota archaeon]